MKSVQKWLKKLKTERLIKEYFYKYPINLADLDKVQSLSVAQVRELGEERLRKFIKKLRHIKPKKMEHEAIFFACEHIVEEDLSEPTFDLIHTDELLEKGNEAEGYSYKFCKQAEIVGFLVADLEFTKENIYELMAEILYEASFFGFESKGVKKANKHLKKAIKEVEEGKVITDDEFRAKFGIKEKERDERADELSNAVIKAKFEYSKYMRDKELELLKASLVQSE
ncbi:hypothetical protein OFO10_01275 [Campylobacter sp. VBCF_06 NA8]|uniref:DUF6557 family protein n=1 Tax=Campylobacter sp. VBCF_06 NA8 TaxID=2983822 RepID=UPI0022E9C472|nr:DUF6557 family protein [Campylobacter sp. VBCF_06 NA8]MDA3045784.1 hypothetical protein [Campylobacter sp. VBCF_06 NA8]